MMKFSLLLTAFCVLFSFPLTAFQTDSLRQSIGREIQTSIQEDMLKHWYPRAVDREFGGFLSDFTYDWQPTGEHNKMIVTQSRQIWSNAMASIQYPENTEYVDNAVHGFKFLQDKIWDEEFGGFHTLVDRKGKVISKPEEAKTAYGNAFAIYGLSALFQANGDSSALKLAQETFHWLEEHSHDKQYKGYHQHMLRDGTQAKRTANTTSTSDLGYKDQNSAIHLLEAFTALYAVWPDALLRERLEEMLLLVRDTITNEKGNLVLFFEPDWTPVSFRHTDEATILKHRYLDHVSFGHDVETAFLMLEASHLLGYEDDAKTMAIAKRMVDHALENGWDSELGGFYDQGYYFEGEEELRIINEHKNWWAQAEGLNALLLMADHFPEDEQAYFDKFRQLWTYIEEYIIDQEHGGWFENGLDTAPEAKTAAKGHIWKANYHQFRSLLHCMHRLLPETEGTFKDQRKDQ